jgi:hypothetical protein
VKFARRGTVCIWARLGRDSARSTHFLLNTKCIDNDWIFSSFSFFLEAQSSVDQSENEKEVFRSKIELQWRLVLPCLADKAMVAMGRRVPSSDSPSRYNGLRRERRVYRSDLKKNDKLVS